MPWNTNVTFGLIVVIPVVIITVIIYFIKSKKRIAMYLAKEEAL